MSYRPAKWLEFLAQTLVPPAGAEHTLGDIAECSNSARQYLSNLVTIFPSAIWCQVRRRMAPVGFLVCALLSAFSIGAAVAFFAETFFSEPRAALRLTVPWAVWLAGNVLAAAYGPADQKARWNHTVLAATVVVALLVAAVLDVPLAGLAAGFGLLIAIFVVLTMPWVNTSRILAPVTLGTLPEHARIFQKTIWWRNVRESSVGAFLIVTNAFGLTAAEGRLDIVVHLLLITGILFIIYYLHFRANSRPVPEGDLLTVLRFHRNEVARQRDILRAVPLWYVMPLVPGMIAQLLNNWNGLRSVIGLLGVAGVIALVCFLNLWGARWLDRQLKDVEALEKSFE